MNAPANLSLDYFLKAELTKSPLKKNWVVLNDFFESYEDFIAERLVRYISNHSQPNDYSSEEEIDFVSFCKFHRSTHSFAKEAKNSIVLVHPFYTSLRHHYDAYSNFLEGFDTEYSAYIEKIFELFSNFKNDPETEVVLWDAPDDYARLTSLLLENSYVSNAFFTQYNTGGALDHTDIDYFADKNVFVGGGYYGYCFDHFFASASRNWPIGKLPLSVTAISDLVIKAPNKEKLSPSSIKILTKKIPTITFEYLCT